MFNNGQHIKHCIDRKYLAVKITQNGAINEVLRGHNVQEQKAISILKLCGIKI